MKPGSEKKKRQTERTQGNRRRRGAAVRWGRPGASKSLCFFLPERNALHWKTANVHSGCTSRALRKQQAPGPGPQIPRPPQFHLFQSVQL